MSDKSISNVCQDPTQSLTVQVPCQLAERVERYAQENGSNPEHEDHKSYMEWSGGDFDSERFDADAVN